jgi:hypothetical protein
MRPLAALEKQYSAPFPHASLDTPFTIKERAKAEISVVSHRTGPEILSRLKAQIRQTEKPNASTPNTPAI